MNLRARLSVAFAVLVLGPALVGGVLLLILITDGPAPPDDPALRQSAMAVRTAVAARCHALEVQARALAEHAAAQGVPFMASPGGEYGPWAICGAGPSPVPLPAGTRYGALAARAEIRGLDGTLRGYAYALQPLDEAFLAGLSTTAGRTVSVRPAGAGTGSADEQDADSGTEPGAGAELEPGAAQPLPLVLSSADPGAAATVPALAAVTVTALVLAVGFGWWLAKVATRPLGALLVAVEQVSAGDLTVRSRMPGRDEVGRLSNGLDRLIEEIEERQRLSITDPLTGLGNLRYLTESLRLEVERAARFDRALGVLVMDLDHFKSVNDQFGHRGGDVVLVEFARRVRGVVREVDLVFRQGGEEFVILLPETDVPGSLTAGRRIRDAVRDRPFALLGGDAAGRLPDIHVRVTVSIGIAVFPRHAVTGAEILDAADEALYAAKAAGRDTYVLARPPVPDQGWKRPRPRTATWANGPCLPAEGGGASGGTTPPRSGPAG